MSRARRQARHILKLTALEERAVPAGIRTIDGSGNNVLHPDWGKAGITFLRQSPSAYADGLSAPVAGRPSARVVSNAVADQGDADIISRSGLSAMIYGWGQFLDHDLDLTNAAEPTQSFPIRVPSGDPYFDPYGTNTVTIGLSRSEYAVRPGPRQQVNSITAWIDGSQIYGSDSATAASLRTYSNGQMKTSDGNLLPVDDDGFFLAGDVRVNENPELTSLQTLFVREHNRIAARLKLANPSASDEMIYQQARARVIAELQAITYNEWLPTLLGTHALRPYQGYKPQVNPGIANEFATAGFRLGHSMLGNDIEFLDNNGNEIADEVELADAFFNPALVSQNGIDSILKYLASDPSSEIDTQVVGGVRNFLFGPPGAGGFDLASLNIQRGREHGLSDYNTTRAAYGLPRVTSFAQITRNVQMQQKLQQLYGNVNNIDLWVGGLAEDHTPDGNTGPLIRRILADQFERLRDGDRFWYEINFSGSELRDLRATTLSDVIRRNTTTTNLQQNAFRFQVSIDGVVFDDRNRDGRQQRNEAGLAGRTVDLLDAGDGSIVATTHTNSRGEYSFDSFDGLRTGQYRVRQQLPPGWLATGHLPNVLAVTRGDLFLHRDLGSVRAGHHFTEPILNSVRGGVKLELNSSTPATTMDDDSNADVPTTDV